MRASERYPRPSRQDFERVSGAYFVVPLVLCAALLAGAAWMVPARQDAAAAPAATAAEAAPAAQHGA